jgi:hypothetical protein
MFPSFPAPADPDDSQPGQSAPPSTHAISRDRQKLYYIGWIMSGIGILLFVSAFFAPAYSPTVSGVDDRFFQGASGILLVFVGGGLASIGARGLAGSGIVLDPQQARKDAEPWSRMRGGMLNDMLEEVDVIRYLAPPAPVVKVRCRECRALNDEANNYCGHCGRAL